MNYKNVVIAISAIFFLGGCATANVVVIQSANKLAQPYHLKHIHVLYVHPKRNVGVDQFGDERVTRVDHEAYLAHRRLADESLDKIPEAFEKIGISSDVIRIEGRVKQANSEGLQKLFSDKYEGPIVVVKPIAKTSCPYSHTKCITDFNVKVELLDTTSKNPTPVWRAEILAPSPTVILWSSGVAQEVARAMVEKMKVDKVID
ncbi:MAG: hypothetical protein WC696_11695 [Candidatus Methylopumilus sp.]|jgi:hypothetical protein